MNIVPIISKIVEHEGVFYALNADDETLFATSSQEIANLYFAIPDVLARQAEIIHELSDKLTNVTNDYNSIVMGIMHGPSHIIH
jgi:hypothetical protein